MAILFRPELSGRGAVIVRTLATGVEETLPLADVTGHIARRAEDGRDERNPRAEEISDGLNPPPRPRTEGSEKEQA